MKTTEFAECIVQLLRETGMVMVPGLGGFRGQYAPATMDYVLGDLHPPRLQVEFDANLAFNDGLLVEYLSRMRQVSSTVAGQMLEHFVAQVKDTLEQREIVILPELGRLQLDFEGHLQFLPDEKNLLPEAYGLPALHFRPLSPLETSPVEHPETGADSKSEKGNRLAVGMMIFAVLLAVMTYFQWKTELSALLTRQKPAVPQIMPDPVPEKMEEAPEEVMPVSGSVETRPEPISEEARPKPIRAYEGIIAVGVFRDTENARRLEQRIREAGFEPFSEETSGLTRVGVKYSVQQEEEIARILEDVRRKFSAEAFILKR